MIQAVLWSAFWIVLLAIGGLSVWQIRRGNGALLSARPALVAVAVLSMLLTLTALYIGYVAPLAIMQDIVASRQALQGEPVPVEGLGPYAEAALEEEPVSPAIEDAWAPLAEEAQEELRSLPDNISEQAHPPFMTLFVAPFVSLFGVHGTFLAIFTLSVGSLIVSLTILARALGVSLSASQKTLVAFAFLGWMPMWWVLRAGQWDALLSGLIVVAWYCIRRQRPVWGGVAIGVATSLKIVPGLLLVYFLIRHLRAFVAGVCTIVVLNLIAVALFGRDFYLQYMQAMHVVFDRHSGSDLNWSLLGALHRIYDVIGIPALSFMTSKPVFVSLASAVVAALCAIVLSRRGRPSTPARYDLEYSLFVAAMVLLSPLSWFHYSVMLLLPLSVLAKEVFAKDGELDEVSLRSAGKYFAIFAVLAIPPAFVGYAADGIETLSWRIGDALFLVPSLTLASIVAWIATLAVRMHGEDSLVLPLRTESLPAPYEPERGLVADAMSESGRQPRSFPHELPASNAVSNLR